MSQTTTLTTVLLYRVPHKVRLLFDCSRFHINYEVLRLRHTYLLIYFFDHVFCSSDVIYDVYLLMVAPYFLLPRCGGVVVQQSSGDIKHIQMKHFHLHN